MDYRLQAWSVLCDESLFAAAGPTVDPVICKAFATHNPWWQRYTEGIARLLGSPPIPMAVAPFGASHEQILNGSVTVPKGFLLGQTTLKFQQTHFIRGDCAACFFDLSEEGSTEHYTLALRQERVAVGRSNLLETVAGMCDIERGGSFLLPAGAVGERIRKEVVEETGHDFDVARFINLSAWQHEKAKGLLGYHPEDDVTKATPLSPGGSDEHCIMFAYSAVLPPGSLMAMHGKVAGLKAEGESTLVQILPMADAHFLIKDTKFHTAHNLWRLYLAAVGAAHT